MQEQHLKDILAFLCEAEKLKSILRSANTSSGRQESTAEHSWRLALLMMLMQDYLPECDPLKLMQLAIIHDLGELDDGDIPAIEGIDNSVKYQLEETTIIRLKELLPQPMQGWFYGLWLEYEKSETQEAKVVKALDKIETIVQHNQGNNSKDFDYAYNLNYGKDLVDGHDTLSYLRHMVDEMTKKQIQDQQS